VVGIAFLIAMIGIASSILGSLYLLVRNDHPSDEAKNRRKRLLVSNWKYGLFVIRAQDLAGLWVDQMRLRARKARHLNVGEALVSRIIRSPSLNVVACVGWRRPVQIVCTPKRPPACPAWGWGRIGPGAPLDPDRRQCLALEPTDDRSTRCSCQKRDLGIRRRHCWTPALLDG
jgi:hypothetical protein